MRRHTHGLRLSLGLAAFLAAWGTASAQPVEVSHPVAGFLRRLEEKGLVPIGFYSTLPRDEAEVARVLVGAKAGEARMTAWDRRRLERYLDEFEPVRKRNGTLLHYEDSTYVFHGDIAYYMGIFGRDSIPTGDRFAFGSLTPSVQMLLRGKGYLASSVTIGKERSGTSRFNIGDNYDPQNGLPYNVARKGLTQSSPKVSTFDGFRLVAGSGSSKLGIEAGQDWNQWGPGWWQHPTLGSRPYFWVSDSLEASPEVGYLGTRFPNTYRRGYRVPGEGAPMPQIRFRIGGAHWEYVKIIAQRTGLWKDSAATLIADRLQLQFGTVRLGFTEMLAIGTRQSSFVGYLPGVPLKVAEHEGGDQDNTAMAVDAEWIWTGYGRLYGELYVDDFAGRPLNRWGNKFATVAGASFQDPLGLPSELHVEYSRVDPWVYQHYRSNVQMNHYGALLGSSLPPNSRSLTTSLRFPLALGLEATAEWLFRQRDLQSEGSSIFDVHEPTDVYTKEFLARDVETRNQASLTASWSWSRHVNVRGGFGWLWVDTWRGNPAADLSTPTLGVELDLRY